MKLCHSYLRIEMDCTQC